ncbi:uncharacterized protein LOC113312985 [Papaver somniferum]|uniref:uncharacterized protein LOC113312985 n=1 Tax=Papaver somniferum TaxID=3469 RepID=UPI000E6F868D|nr:uncharacterized protein LOC113312985 [Papaver somniferum]
MGWDPVANTVTASDDAWKRYLKKYPGAKSFRKKGLDNYYMLGEIFNSTTASGSMSNASTRSPPDSDTERDLETEFLGKGVHVEPASSGDTSHPSSHTQSNIHDALYQREYLEEIWLLTGISKVQIPENFSSVLRRDIGFHYDYMIDIVYNIEFDTVQGPHVGIDIVYNIEFPD